MEMTTEQIIKALADAIALGIKYPRVDAHLLIDALEVIKEQLGKIKGLNSAIETLQGVAKDYENRNENLKRENQYLREHMWDEAEHAKDLVITDTVKKMQEMLISAFCPDADYCGYDIHAAINAKAGEMLE